MAPVKFASPWPPIRPIGNRDHDRNTTLTFAPNLVLQLRLTSAPAVQGHIFQLRQNWCLDVTHQACSFPSCSRQRGGPVRVVAPDRANSSEAAHSPVSGDRKKKGRRDAQWSALLAARWPASTSTRKHSSAVQHTAHLVPRHANMSSRPVRERGRVTAPGGRVSIAIMRGPCGWDRR
jgi:hypothetical protein